MSWTQDVKLTAGDGSNSDIFGRYVSISGDYAVVGARNDDNNKGAAYIFKKNSEGWSQQTKITASDGASNDQFGWSVGISGDYVIAGAYGESSNKGAAYIFKRDSEGWTQEAKITASDGVSDDQFGWAVGIDGNYAIIGSRNDDSNKGSVYIFLRDDSNGWEQQQKLTPSTRINNERVGYSVGISGNYAILGALGSNNYQGAAYIFKRTNTSWSQIKKITASDGVSDDNFAWSVAIDGEFAVVGAWKNDDTATDSGSAYIYKKGDGDSWNQLQKLNANDAAYQDRYGQSVDIDGKFIIVGARYNDDNNATDSGSAYIYIKSDDDDSWTLKQKITASDASANDQFSVGVAVDGNFIVVGAWGDDLNGTDKGSAYIFSLDSPDTWNDLSSSSDSDKYTRRHTDINNYFDNISENTFSASGSQLGLDSSKTYVVHKFTNSMTIDASNANIYCPLEGINKYLTLNFGSQYIKVTQTSANNAENSTYQYEISANGTDNWSNPVSKNFGETYTSGDITIRFGGVGSEDSSNSNTSGSSICYHEDTLIKTDQGMSKIKYLTQKHTIGGSKIVYLIKSNYVKRLVLIKKHAFGFRRPERDIKLTENHEILLNNNVLPISHYINGNTVKFIDNTIIKSKVYNIFMVNKKFIKVSNLNLGVISFSRKKFKTINNLVKNNNINTIKCSLNSYSSITTDNIIRIKVSDYKKFNNIW